MVAVLRSRLNAIAELARRGSVFVILLSLMTVFALLTDRFLTFSNLSNVLEQTAVVTVITVGMTFTMLMAGIDLSVGSVAAFCGAISAGLIVWHGVPTALAMAAALLLGLAIGYINGVLIVYGKLPPFVATLSTMGIARGLTLVYTEGKPISGLGRDYTFWGSGALGPIPVPVLVSLAVVIAALVVLRGTKFGLHVYAIGGNEETTRLAGVPVNRVKLLVYGISGLTAALGGLLLTGRLWSAQPQAGVGLELEAIAAAVLGGVSLFGGVGGVIGAVVGSLIIGVLGNGLNLMRVPSYHQQMTQGVLLILAVVIDLYTKRRRA